MYKFNLLVVTPLLAMSSPTTPWDCMGQCAMICGMIGVLLLSAGISDIKTFIIENSQYNYFRQLGFSAGSATSFSHFGRVPDSFALDNVQCVGTERTLQDCPHLTRDDCSGYEGAGVVCTNGNQVEITTSSIMFG